jgi:hypothetical protein
MKNFKYFLAGVSVSFIAGSFLALPVAMAQESDADFNAIFGSGFLLGLAGFSMALVLAWRWNR